MISTGKKFYQERTYRNLVNTAKLKHFQVVVKETDLLVHAERKLEAETRELVLEHRGYVEAFIKTHPGFTAALTPWRLDGPAPKIVVDMVNAGTNAGVGPMAAVAGAIAEHVGTGLLKITNQVIVENGGDVFIKTEVPVTCGQQPVAVCTSSGTVGHSLSFGKADAVCIIADSCAVADAVATAIGNLVQSPADINDAINAGKKIDKIGGIIIIADDKIGIWGDLEVRPLKGKKG